MKDTPRVVFDCNVLLQAAARRNSVAARCLNLAETNLIQLFISRDTFAEIEEVLNRPELRVHFDDLNDEVVGAFLKRLQKHSSLVRLVPKKFSYSRDEDDEPYINLAAAAAAEADYLVSRDKDLLDLMTGHTDECKEFRQRFRPLKVIEPLAFLQLIREQNED